MEENMNKYKKNKINLLCKRLILCYFNGSVMSCGV